MNGQLRFVDASGWTWRVCELSTIQRDVTADGTAGPSARVSRLYFYARYATRRLSKYPADWTRLAPAELSRLCQAALPLSTDDLMPLDEPVAPRRVAAEGLTTVVEGPRL